MSLSAVKHHGTHHSRRSSGILTPSSVQYLWFEFWNRQSETFFMDVLVKIGLKISWKSLTFRRKAFRVGITGGSVYRGCIGDWTPGQGELFVRITENLKATPLSDYPEICIHYWNPTFWARGLWHSPAPKLGVVVISCNFQLLGILCRSETRFCRCRYVHERDGMYPWNRYPQVSKWWPCPNFCSRRSTLKSDLNKLLWTPYIYNMHFNRQKGGNPRSMLRNQGKGEAIMQHRKKKKKVIPFAFHPLRVDVFFVQ